MLEAIVWWPCMLEAIGWWPCMLEAIGWSPCMLEAIGWWPCMLEAIANRLRNCRVRWFTDNRNVARLLLVGSRKEHLQLEVLKVFSLCVSHGIHLEPEWIPRKENELADYISRIVDSDDWQLEPILFAWLDNVWGPHTVDRVC